MTLEITLLPLSVMESSTSGSESTPPRRSFPSDVAYRNRHANFVVGKREPLTSVRRPFQTGTGCHNAESTEMDESGDRSRIPRAPHLKLFYPSDESPPRFSKQLKWEAFILFRRHSGTRASKKTSICIRCEIFITCFSYTHVVVTVNIFGGAPLENCSWVQFFFGESDSIRAERTRRELYQSQNLSCTL